MKVALCCVLVFFVIVGVLHAALPPADNNYGGYHDRDVNDEYVREAALFAAAEMGHELVEILAAQSAVVAGFNYRMELMLKKGNNTKTCIVVVFQGLMNAPKELTSAQCVM